MDDTHLAFSTSGHRTDIYFPNPGQILQEETNTIINTPKLLSMKTTIRTTIKLNQT